MAHFPLSRFFAACLLVVASTGCMSLEYDLSGVPLPVSAKPADAGAASVEPFVIEARSVLWAHGLFGRSTPDVGELVRTLVEERGAGVDRIANFRVRQTSNVHQWLATHLSLTLVRMRRVVVEGQLVRDR